MDCGSDYIKMCEKAKEIQSHVLMEGDFYYSDNWEEGHELIPHCVQVGVDYESWSGKVLVSSRRHIWLPRQDQLQEMVEAHNIISLRALFIIWGEEFDYYEQFASMEQLWLAFTMKSKYNKVWSSDKNEWNKDEKG